MATEFFVVHRRRRTAPSGPGTNGSGSSGFYFLGVFTYLMITTVPKIQWRGPFDVIAVGFYLSGVIPLFGIALQELGVIGKVSSSEAAMVAKGKSTTEVCKGTLSC